MEIKKRICFTVVFAFSVDDSVKNQRNRKESQVIKPCQRTKIADE